VKFFGNWRQIVDIKHADYCSFMKDPNLPITKFVLQYQNFMQRNMHECPYEIGPLKMFNFTDTYHQKMSELDRKGHELPDGFFNTNFKGDFRVKLNMRTSDDDNVFNITLVYALSYRNADRF